MIPGPSLPPVALIWSSPEITWIWPLTRSSGSMVRLRSKSLPSFLGHQFVRLTPLGT